jgi:hypothetical protein
MGVEARSWDLSRHRQSCNCACSCPSAHLVSCKSIGMQTGWARPCTTALHTQDSVPGGTTIGTPPTETLRAHTPALADSVCHLPPSLPPSLPPRLARSSPAGSCCTCAPSCWPLPALWPPSSSSTWWPAQTAARTCSPPTAPWASLQCAWRCCRWGPLCTAGAAGVVHQATGNMQPKTLPCLLCHPFLPPCHPSHPLEFCCAADCHRHVAPAD